MRIAYEKKRFSDGSLSIIAHANRICAEYAEQGYDLTLRQLYYQFVSRDLIPNKQSEYKRVGSIINDARMAGKLDWDYIVDRTRNLESNSHWSGPEEVLEAVAEQFQIDKWSAQAHRLEVWIEKDALVGVLEGCCPQEDVPYFSCRGYTSQSEMWGASQRLGKYLQAGQSVTILHLGDHDPSGIDMTRDITDRLRTFIAQDYLRAKVADGEIDEDPEHGWDRSQLRDARRDVLSRFRVERIALNMKQIEQYNPPPNPAKLSDSRASGYVATHGYSSWELDALEPTVLVGLIREAIEEHREPEEWYEQVAEERQHRELLGAASERWDDVKEMLA